jgi:hypothetical protein
MRQAFDQAIMRIPKFPKKEGHMTDKKLSRSRRTFIKYAAIFGGSALWLVLGRPAAAEPKQPLPEKLPSGEGYRLTEHIKKYYETARL